MKFHIWLKSDSETKGKMDESGESKGPERITLNWNQAAYE